MPRPPILVGCQGWRYPDWRTQAVEAAQPAAPFYSPDIPPERELWHYARTFALVEVDSTFYAVPPARVVAAWRDETPDDFRFTLKLPRALTHEARLERGRRTLEEFCTVARALGEKLAAVLIQLPPSFGPGEYATLERFLPHLPTDLRFAVEFRERGWLDARTADLLAAHRVAFALGETPWLPTAVALPWLAQVATDWLYLRFMGVKEGGLSRFTHLQEHRVAVYDAWAPAIADCGKTVYALMDNHFEGFSPGSAVRLSTLLGLPVRPFPRDQPKPISQLALDL